MMMGQCKRRSIYTLCLFIALFTWCIGLASAQRLQTYERIVEIRYDDNKMSSDKIDAILKNEMKSEDRLIQSMVAWEQIPNLTIANEILGRSSQVDVLNLYGDSHTLVPTYELTGEHLITADTTGCIISDQVADELWGSLDVIGKTISYKEQEYVVRGVLEEDSPIMLIQTASADKDIKFSGLRIQFFDNENMKEKMRQFIGRYGLPEGVQIDLSLDTIIWTQLILLPAWIIAMIIVWTLGKKAYSVRRQWKKCMLWSGIVLVAGVSLIKITAFKIEVPIYFIPNQWSDFEFWSRTWQQLQAERMAVESLPKYIPDMWRLGLLQTLKGGLIISGITFFLASRWLEVENLKSLFWNILISMFISFGAILLVHYSGIQVVVIASVWLIWPSYIVLRFGMNK